jgi:Fe-S-cluster containining protein
MSQTGYVVVKFSLTVGDREMEASARVPAGPVRVADILPVLHNLASAVIAVGEEQAREQGKVISCRAGCGTCCRQIVPISEMDARYLAALVEAMPEARRARVAGRFRAAVARLEELGLIAKCREISRYTPDERLEIAMDYFFAGIACPFLEDESCSIHPARPMVCREHLVTNPPENCANPTAANTQMVPLPAKPSLALYRFTDGVGEDKWRYLPLVLALEWAAEHAGDEQPKLPGPEILMNFLRRLANLPKDWTPPPAQV